jgi:predicted alpha/beta hydrolase
VTGYTPEILPVAASDGHRWELLAWIPPRPVATLLWLPAMGVAAKHYRSFAEALAARGVATFVHEWRGNGSSSRRASHRQDWGYAELLGADVPASEAVVAGRCAGLVRTVGGHSLGGQLACCRLALAPDSAQRLWLVASGAPYWRAFPPPTRYGLILAYRFLPWLADRFGVLPGRRLGFAGQEARGVIRDWARSALSGRYGTADARLDPEPAMRAIDIEVHAVLMRHDWLVPPSSLQYLLAKLGTPSPSVAVLDDAALGARADHFAWMARPDAVVAHLTR